MPFLRPLNHIPHPSRRVNYPFLHLPSTFSCTFPFFKLFQHTSLNHSHYTVTFTFFGSFEPNTDFCTYSVPMTGDPILFSWNLYMFLVALSNSFLSIFSPSKYCIIPQLLMYQHQATWEQMIYSKTIYKPCYDACYEFTLHWLLEIVRPHK